jgi:TRAP-type uncharacterized transport system substrate-binding protein
MSASRERTELGFKEKEKMTRIEILKILLPTVALTIIGFLVAFQFVDPAPPRNISMACGTPGGASCNFANEYRDFMAKEGVTLSLKTSAGAMENLELLQQENDGADVAFVQGGLASLVQDSELMSLGSLFYEPLWVFYRSDLLVDRPKDMKGMRLAVGEDGSGTKILTMKLLKLNGINSQNSSILSVGYEKAAEQLAAGEVDVAFFVSTHHATYVDRLLKLRAVTLLGIQRAEAYTFLHPYLYLLKLPEGVIDLEANIPSSTLKLVASTTELVAKNDLHPALVNLLMQAAAEVHETGTAFERRREFPSTEYLAFELSEEAENYFNSGPTFLQRYLPFWVANYITRMKILLVPLVVVFYPLFKLVPLLYGWRMRSRIYRWYVELDSVDPDLHRDELGDSTKKFLLKLDEIEDRVCKVTVPSAYSEGLYALRLHIGMLRGKLQHTVRGNASTDDTGTSDIA